VKKLIFEKLFFKMGLTFVVYSDFSEKILVENFKLYFNLLDLRFEKEKATR
jgi:hypothetical protein